MKYRQNSNVVDRIVAGEHLLVPVSGDVVDMRQLFSLNPTAQTIWKALAQATTEDQVVEAITSEFNVEASMARKDVQELLATLLERKLIQCVPT